MVTRETPCSAFLLAEQPLEIEAVRTLSEQDGKFAISHIPENSTSWVELLFDGLTFDLDGLGGHDLSAPKAIHQFDIETGNLADASMLTLGVGPHIAAAGNMPAIVRAQMQLLSSLCALPKVQAVGWTPASSAMSKSYFKRVIDNWINGGPFPALGLTALERTSQDALRSVGLTYFTGQEIEVPHGEDEQESAAKLALRVIDYLVDAGPIDNERTIKGPDDGLLLLSNTSADGLVQVLR